MITRWFGLVLPLVLVGCSDTSGKKPDATKSDQQVSSNILENYQKSQPVPMFNYSQLRQNLIEIETAQSNTTQTTTFFFNQGVQQPVMTCPSIGFPIAATNQLTNPQQMVTNGNNTWGWGAPLAQIDPNGVFSGDTTGTYVMCVNAQGKAYANYWEGFVQTITGPAVWDEASHSIKLTGPPSFDFSTQKK